MSTWTDKNVPNPGSVEALKQNCRCAVLDNGYGKGHLGDGDKYGWWVSEDCPLHGTTINSLPADSPQDAKC